MTKIVSGAILGTLAVIVCLYQADAQTGGKDKDMKVKGQLPPGWKKLNLSAEQKTKIYTVQSDFRGKIKKLDDEIKKLRTQEHIEMVKVLTDAQKAELAKGLLPDDKKPDEKPKEKK